MPKIILKCRYLKHEKAHLAHLVRYIATREGVEMARDTHDHLPATARQKQLIDELLRSLPETQESYEYRDYQANPTMGNALAFISISIEQNISGQDFLIPWQSAGLQPPPADLFSEYIKLGHKLHLSGLSKDEILKHIKADINKKSLV